MSAKDHRILEADIVAPEIYARERSERRGALIPVKRSRRLEVGPYATFYFENFDTMLAQVHESWPKRTAKHCPSQRPSIRSKSSPMPMG